MNDHDARMLTAWFDANEVRGSEASLGRALAATKGAPQRPGWLVSLRGGTIAGDNQQRSSLALRLLVATALIAALVAGAVIGGGGITPRPIPSPALPSARAERAARPLADAARRDRGGPRPGRVHPRRPARRMPSGPTAKPVLRAAPVGRQPGRQQRPRALLPGRRGPPDRAWLVAGRPLAAVRSDCVPTLTDASGSEVRPLNAVRG